MKLIPNDRRLGWTPYAWLIYLVPFLVTPFFGPMRAARLVETGIGTLLFLVLYFRGFWVRGRALVLVMAALSVLGAVFLPINLGAGAFFIYAAGFAGGFREVRHAVWSIAGITAFLVLAAGLERLPLLGWAWAAVFSVFIGAVNLHFGQVARANRKLEMAQEEIEHLARMAERERIARDLHDLLGHTLSVIVLKSELASKLAERDPARAIAEIRDVERISRDALSEVRSAVRGYRSGGLASELAGSREMLETAGVKVECRVEVPPMPAAQEAVLALALREAATNIVRHAEAGSCVITLERTSGACSLRIHDDGKGGSPEEGSGLSGMRERISALGGSLARDGSGGTTLTITLPLPMPGSAVAAAVERG